MKIRGSEKFRQNPCRFLVRLIPDASCLPGPENYWRSNPSELPHRLPGGASSHRHGVGARGETYAVGSRYRDVIGARNDKPGRRSCGRANQSVATGARSPRESDRCHRDATEHRMMRATGGSASPAVLHPQHCFTSDVRRYDSRQGRRVLHATASHAGHAFRGSAARAGESLKPVAASALIPTTRTKRNVPGRDTQGERSHASRSDCDTAPSPSRDR